MRRGLLLVFLSIPAAAAQLDRPALLYPPGALLRLEPGEALRDAPAPAAQGTEAAAAPAASEPDDKTLIPAPPKGRAGWVKAPSSLLLYDAEGSLVSEVGLGQWDEDAGGGNVLRRVVRGGTSRDGRFAWSWERAETVKPGRSEKTISSIRLLRYLGTNGAELFRNELADAPKDLDPVAATPDGETVLVLERGPDAWIAAAYDFLGSRIADAHGKGTVELAELASNGRWALIRWHQLDQPPVYGVMDLKRRASSELPSAKLPVGRPRITDEGRVLVGEKIVFQPK